MSKDLPNLNGLRAFEAAGRHLNFRAAATELGVTQGAVAQQVRRLEAALALPLFDRHAKGLGFTAAGRAYHRQIGAAFDHIRHATTALQPGMDRVTISVTPTFAAKWLLPRLPELQARQGAIELQVLATETLSSFHRDGVDLMVRRGRPPFGAGLDQYCLFEDQIVAVASPDLVPELPLSPVALNALPKLHDSHNLWPGFLATIATDDFSPDQTGGGLRFSQTALAIDAACAGQGVALASRFLVARDIAARRLVMVSPHVMSEDAGFYLLARKGSGRSPAVQQVMDWVIATARLS